MSTFKTEAEQVDDLKRWIKSYGPSVIAGILIALAIIYGKQFWQSYKTQKAQDASASYQTAISAFEQKQNDILNQNADKLINDASDTPYAEYITLLQAKIAVDAHDYPTAIQKLKWAVGNASDDNLKILAILRLAKLQIANQQAELALETLNTVESKHYAGLVDIVRGDAYFALGKHQDAKQAYLKAQQAIPNADQLMPTLQMRIDNSGE